MRQITVDFTSQTYPLFAGYLGEHNATELVAIKPSDMSGAMYSLAFMTNGEVIHSKYFSADEEIKVTLWQQLTQDNTLYVQLEAYDENGAYLAKSAMTKLVLSNSAHGMDVVADADNADVYSEIAQNSAFRENLRDNVDTLDKLTTSKDGRLLFNGRLVEGSGGGANLAEYVGYSNEKLGLGEDGNVKDALDIIVDNVETNADARHTHSNKEVLDDFGINYADTRPTFRSNSEGKTNVIAFQEDISERVALLRTEVFKLISAIPKFSIAVVDELPEENISETTVYLVRNLDGIGDDAFKEYIYVDGEWELLGAQIKLITDVTPEQPPLVGGSGIVIDVEEIEGGHRVTITDANGTESFDVLNGKDYVLTDTDKTEIANTVVALLPKYNGEVVEV